MKIRFNNKEFPVNDGASLSRIEIPSTPSVPVNMIVAEIMTKENLSSVDFVEDSGKVSGHYDDMILIGNTYSVYVPKYEDTMEEMKPVVIFGLREKTDVEKRLDALEESQSIQDGAIADLGDVVSEIMEG